MARALTRTRIASLPPIKRPAPDFAAERAMAALYGLPIAGIDEAGRGPWAGPVVAAAVILDMDCELPEGINDSKRLTESQRDRLFDAITGCAVAYGVGLVGPEDIDRINIRQATHLAMSRAIEALVLSGPPPVAVLVDGNDPPAFSVPTRALVDGDALSLSIASASILAKVTRDRMMVALDAEHPGYGFGRHKGYGTAQHAEALLRLGPCPIHRMTFAPVASARRGF